MQFLKLVRRSGKQVWALTRGHGAAIILFTLIFLMVTWPWVRTPGSSILGSAIADAWEEVEQFWWYKQALIELRVSPFLNPNIFFPEGWHTVTGSHSPTLMLPTVPFTMLMGPIGSYFFLMLAGFVFAGLGTYVAIYHLTQDRLAGVLGGVSYAFCMSRMLRLGGHFNTATGSAWIPWVFAFLELAYSQQNSRRQDLWAAATGIAYAAAMLSYWYFVYIIAIPLATYLIIQLWRVRHERTQVRSLLRRALIIFVGAGILVAPFALFAYQARAEVGVNPHSLEATVQQAVSLDRFLIPNRYHPIWGNWFRARFPDQGGQSFIFLGLTATVLAISAIARRIHPRTAVYAAVMFVSMVMAMGPQMYWNNAPVQLELPWHQGTGIPLPGLLFFRYAPLFNTIRVWARFSLVTSFAVALLAGLAAAHLRQRFHWGLGMVLVLTALVTLESFGHPFVVVPAEEMVRDVDRWLASQSDQFAIMELPLNDRLNGSLNYSQTLHGKQLATGYATAMPAFFMQAVPHFASFPNQKTVNILRRWGVRYLLYTVREPAAFQEEVAPAIGELSGLTYVATFDGHPEPYINFYLGKQVYVYAITESSP